MSEKIYKDSGIELSPTIAKHYDKIMNSISFGKYHSFILKAVKDMQIKEKDEILDMGCGTGKNAALMAHYLGAGGHITGIDLSPVMEKQFLNKHKDDKRFSFIKQRIDQPFDLEKRFDKVLISFVIHGFPHTIRKKIIENAYKHLKPGGELMILDYSEFNMKDMPGHHRFIFRKVECIYAFDYLERDWKNILSEYGFGGFTENLYLRSYARLLKAIKEK